MIGSIFIARNKQQIDYINSIRGQYSRNNKLKFVVVDDTTSSSKDVICASIMLPSSSSLVEMVEGNIEKFSVDYLNYLLTDQTVTEFMMVLMAGLLYYEIDYILYIDDSIDNSIEFTLEQYLMNIGLVEQFNPFGLRMKSVSPNCINNLITILSQNGYNPKTTGQSPFVQF
jgi:hypothetical protein